MDCETIEEAVNQIMAYVEDLTRQQFHASIGKDFTDIKAFRAKVFNELRYKLVQCNHEGSEVHASIEMQGALGHSIFDSIDTCVNVANLLNVNVNIKMNDMRFHVIPGRSAEYYRKQYHDKYPQH